MAIIALVETLASSFNCKTYASINTSDQPFFPKEIPFVTSQQDTSEGETFDLITTSTPLGLRVDSPAQFKARKISASSKQIIEALPHLTNKGICVSLVEPVFLHSQSTREFGEQLHNVGFYISGACRLPENCFAQAQIRPIAIIITRSENSNLFACEITDQEQTRRCINNFTEKRKGKSLEEGVIIPLSEFKGFNQTKAALKINSLKSEYKTYSISTMKDLAENISRGRPGLSLIEAENSIYLQDMSMKVFTELLDAPKNHTHLTQIELNKQIKCEYLKRYLETEYGQLILEATTSGEAIKRIDRKALEQLDIPLPSLDEQKAIIETSEKLRKLTEAINELENELAVKPKSANEITEHATNMLNQIGKLTLADRIRDLIRSGESSRVEFKQTLSWDIRKNEKSKELEKASLKNIVAFMNSNGGSLLIGIADNGEITGIDDEIYRLRQGSKDKFLLHLNNIIGTRIGEQFYPFITISHTSMKGKTVLCIDCEPSQNPSYLDENDFYIRTHPATALLQGSKLIDYVKNHFSM